MTTIWSGVADKGKVIATFNEASNLQRAWISQGKWPAVLAIRNRARWFTWERVAVAMEAGDHQAQ